jgi:hypothetical protein
MNLIHPARKIDFSILKVCGRFPEVIIIVYDITNNKENGDKHSPEQVNRGFGCTDLFGGCATAAQYNKGNFLSHDQGTLKFNLQFFSEFHDGDSSENYLEVYQVKNAFGFTHPRRHASNHTATRLSPPPSGSIPMVLTSPFFGDFAPPWTNPSKFK